MRQRRVLLVAALGGLLAPALTVSPAAAIPCAPWDHVCHLLNGAQGQEQANRDQLTQIENKISDVQAKMHALGALIVSLDSQIQAEETQIEDTQRAIEALDARIQQTEADLASREAQLQLREQLFAERVRAMDKQGAVNWLALVLTSTSFNDLLDRIVMVQQIIHSDRLFIEELRWEKEQVQKLRDSLRNQRDEKAQLLAAQEQQRAQLETDLQAQQDALVYQKKLAVQFDAQRKELEREQAAIALHIKQLQAQYAAEARAAGGGTGQFVWPEQGSFFISQGFGCTDVLMEPYWPSCPTLHFHTGIDIAGADGAPVYTADAGVASVFSQWGGYGNFIIVTHGNGWSTLYGHLSGFAVGEGQLVYRGQLIGSEGSTGFSTGPHLHFEIRYFGAYQNPCAYLGC